MAFIQLHMKIHTFCCRRVCVCMSVFFPFLCYCPSSPGFQEGRVEFARTWPSKLRKGGRSSRLLGYSAPWFTGSRANGEVNSSSVLLLEGVGLLTKMLLLRFSDRIFPSGMS